MRPFPASDKWRLWASLLIVVRCFHACPTSFLASRHCRSGAWYPCCNFVATALFLALSPHSFAPASGRVAQRSGGKVFREQWSGFGKVFAPRVTGALRVAVRRSELQRRERRRCLFVHSSAVGASAAKGWPGRRRRPVCCRPRARPGGRNHRGHATGSKPMWFHPNCSRPEGSARWSMRPLRRPGRCRSRGGLAAGRSRLKSSSVGVCGIRRELDGA